jgi:hypothetical protein
VRARFQKAKVRKLFSAAYRLADEKKCRTSEGLTLPVSDNNFRHKKANFRLARARTVCFTRGHEDWHATTPSTVAGL